MPTEALRLPLRLLIGPVGAVATRCAAAPAANGSLEPWIDVTGRDYGYCLAEKDGYRVRIYGVGSFTFGRDSTDVQGAPEPGVAPGIFDDTFWRIVAPCILQANAWEVLHASGLVVAGARVAMCGNSTMGKSTLAHAWRRRGGLVYADDAIPFRVREGSVPICALPFWIRLWPPVLRYFGSSGVDASEPERKARAEQSPPSVTGGLLQVIYVLDRQRDEEGPVLLEAIPPQEALMALLQQATCLTLRDRERNREMVKTYVALVNAVPTYRLSYPTGLGHVDAILDQLTQHVASRTTNASVDADDEE